MNHPNFSTRNIIIAPCGNKSYLFKEKWLLAKDRKEFDLCLLFYHQVVDVPEKYAVAEYFFHLKDFKYHMLYKLFTDVKPGWLEEYDYFYFLDDDIEIDTDAINLMFRNARLMNAQIAQAALTPDSFCSWPIFKAEKNCFCRFSGQIEVMAPLFHKEALKTCLESFIVNKSSWGIDSVWPKLLGNPEKGLIIFDNVMMRHTQPVGGGELYQKLGVSPHAEWDTAIRAYGSKKHYYHELGRLQIVDRDHSGIIYFFIKLKDKLRVVKRVINDFGLPAGISIWYRRIYKKK